jgi:hypothetical protein
MEENEIVDNETTQNIEDVVETTPEETPAVETELTVDDYNKLAQEKKDLEAKNKQLFERAKKAEADAKAKAIPLQTKEPSNVLSREEAILIAKGVDERIINEAGVIAKAKGINLSEAMKDPLIEAYSEKIKAEEKKEKSQLGASKPGPTFKGVPLEQAVGMTEEEHRKAIGM